MKGMSYQKIVFSFALVMLLPACAPFDWIKRKLGKGAEPETEVSAELMSVSMSSDGSPVLVSIGGKPALTLAEFNKELDAFIEKNQLRQYIDAGLIPNFKQQYLKGKKSQLLIDAHIVALGIDKQPDYIEQKEEILKAGQQMLNAKYFTDLYPVTISETDLKKFYEENKDKLPDVLVSRGGVNLVGIKFDNEKDAQAFFDKVKSKPDQFVQEAKTAKLDGKIKEFNIVNEQTVTLEPEIREKVMGYQKFPTTELIKVADKSCWVVFAKEKKEAQCRPFEEVKATIEQYVNRQKRMDVLEKEIDKLNEKYNVVTNESLIKEDNEQISLGNEEDESSIINTARSSQAV